MTQKDNKFRIDLSSSFIVEGLGLAFALVQMLLINRWFGAEIYGQFVIIVASAGIIGNLLTARTSEAVARFYKRESLLSTGRTTNVIQLGFITDIITAFLLVLILYITSTYFAETFLKSESYSSLIVMYSFNTFFLYLRGTIFGFYQATENFRIINLLKLTNNFTALILLVLLSLHTDFSPLVTIISSLTLSSFINFLALLIIFLTDIKVRPLFNISELRKESKLSVEYISFAAKAFFSSSLKLGSTHIDNLMFGYFLNAEVVGIYQTIKRLATPIALLSSSMSLVMMPKIVAWYETDDITSLSRSISRLTIYGVIGALAMALILLLLLEPYTNFQNIELKSSMYAAFGVIAVYFVLGVITWWGRPFILAHSPIVPVYTNLALTINSIWVPIALYNLDFFTPIVTIAVSLLIAYLPSWLVTPAVYRRYTLKFREH